MRSFIFFTLAFIFLILSVLWLQQTFSNERMAFSIEVVDEKTNEPIDAKIFSFPSFTLKHDTSMSGKGRYMFSAPPNTVAFIRVTSPGYQANSFFSFIQDESVLVVELQEEK